MRLNSVFNFFLGSVLILSNSASAVEMNMLSTSSENKASLEEEEAILKHLDETLKKIEDEKKRLRSHLQELKVTVSTFTGKRADMLDKINDGLQCTQNKVVGLQKYIASTQKQEQKKTATMRIINLVAKDKLVLVAKGTGVENAATIDRLREIRRVTKQKKRMYRRLTNNIILDLQEIVEDIGEMKDIAKTMRDIPDIEQFMKKAADIVSILTRIEEPEEKKERLNKEIPLLEEQKKKLLKEIEDLEAKRDELLEDTGVDEIEQQKAQALAEIEEQREKMLEEVEKKRVEIAQGEKAKAIREKKAKATEELKKQKVKAIEDIEDEKVKALEDIEKRKTKASVAGRTKELKKIEEEEEKMLGELKELKKLKKLEHGKGKAAMIGTSSVLSLLITGLIVAGAFLYLKKRQKKRENFNQYFQNPVNEVSPAVNVNKVPSERVSSRVNSEKISQKKTQSKVKSGKISLLVNA